MANTYTTLNDLFTGIADAIRVKTGSTDTIVADNFPTEISNLRTGFDYNNQNVTEIANYQFRNCTDLKSVDIGSATSVGTGAFDGCTNLKQAKLPNTVVNMGKDAFKGCSEDLIIFCASESQPETWNENWNPEGYPVVYRSLIETWDISRTEHDNVVAELYGVNDNYSLVTSGSGAMKVWSKISSIPWYSNYRQNIKFVVIGNSVTSISPYTFYSCSSLTSINIPNSVTSIGMCAFFYCSSLTSVTIPDSVTSIHQSTFYGCSSLTSINIPDSVTSIDSYAFYGCSSLTSINIPDSVTSIGSEVFCDCKSLTSIIYTGTIEQWNTITFEIMDTTEGTLYWDTGIDNYTIYCTDGTITKDGIITYYYTTTGGEG